MQGWLVGLFNREQQDERLIRRFEQIIRTEGDLSYADRLDTDSLQKSPDNLSHDEQAIIETIRKQTEQNNRNNLTRTEAYLTYYKQHLEIHWALLAHMVSRNGGWSMTDVKGSLLRPVLSNRRARSLFDMFERANWLIFHDAYPQLLLYTESVRHGSSLHHLLPYFGVSSFMVPIWQHFWKDRDSSLLTLALIINEQQYIEQRIVKHAHYRRTVTQTAVFKLQTAFDFNQVVFPVAGEPSHPRLVGRTMHNFANVSHRIKTGRMLYHLLFHPDFYERILKWVRHHPHTGSRADYWPERFTYTASEEMKKVYSPLLSDAWQDIDHRPAETGDWYVGQQCLSSLLEVRPQSKPNFYVTDVYERSYSRLRVISFLARAAHRFMQ